MSTYDLETAASSMRSGGQQLSAATLADCVDGPLVALLLRNGSLAVLSAVDGTTLFVRSSVVNELSSGEHFACAVAAPGVSPRIGLRHATVALDEARFPSESPVDHWTCDALLNCQTGDDATAADPARLHFTIRSETPNGAWATVALAGASRQLPTVTTPPASGDVKVCIDGTVSASDAWDTEIGEVVLCAWWITQSEPGTVATVSPLDVVFPDECRKRAASSATAAADEASRSAPLFYFVSAEESTAILSCPDLTTHDAVTAATTPLVVPFVSSGDDAPCCDDDDGEASNTDNEDTRRRGSSSGGSDAVSASDDDDDDEDYNPFCCPGSIIRHRCGRVALTSLLSSAPTQADGATATASNSAAASDPSRALVVVTSPSMNTTNNKATLPKVGSGTLRSTPPSMGVPSFLRPSWGTVVPASHRSPSAPSTPTTTSHFFETFVIEGFLGRGAEGQVLRVRHRLTMVPYAVKTIHLKSDLHATQVLQEINLLARLKHANVISYYHSWTEDVPKVAIEQLETIARAFGRASGRNDGADGEDDGDVADDGDSFSSDDASFSCSAGTSATVPTPSQGTPMAIANGSSPLGTTSSNGDKKGSMMSSTLAVFNANVHLLRSDNPMSVKVLFVLMDVFPTALQDLLAKRNACATSLGRPVLPHCSSGSFDTTTGTVDRIANLTVMLDVLNGLQYLHDQNIVHRDVKPANIFVNPDTLHACIGDLGLAKLSASCDDATATTSPTAPGEPQHAYGGGNNNAANTTTKSSLKLMAELRDVLDRTLLRDSSPSAAASSPIESAHHHHKERRVHGSSSPPAPAGGVASAAVSGNGGGISRISAATHTQGVGSPLYAAPEQLQGTRCDALCDAFAAGLVFLEMYCVFGTAMERVGTLRQAGQRGEIDPFQLSEYPELVIAQALIHPNRAQRLSVRQARSLVKTALLRLQERQERDAEARMVDIDP